MKKKTTRWGLLLLVAGLLIGCIPPPASTTEEPMGLQNGSFTANLNGFRIHYEVHGRGPVLMTVPNSWGLSHQGLRGLYRPLEEHLTLVYFDPRGMGQSGSIREEADMGLAAVRDDFDALRQHLGLERVHAIGWSNGAINLVFLASERPEILSSAIFLHGAASFGEEDNKEMMSRYPKMFERYAAFQKEMASGIPVEEQNVLVKDLFVKEWFPLMLADPDANRDKLVDLYEDAEFSWPHSEYGNQEMPTFDARDRLADIRASSLVLGGRHDMISVAKTEELHEGLSDSTMVIFEESGHFAPVEEPDAFVRTVVDFLGRDGS